MTWWCTEPYRYLVLNMWRWEIIMSIYWRFWYFFASWKFMFTFAYVFAFACVSMCICIVCVYVCWHVFGVYVKTRCGHQESYPTLRQRLSGISEFINSVTLASSLPGGNSCLHFPSTQITSKQWMLLLGDGYLNSHLNACISKVFRTEWFLLSSVGSL